MTNYYVVYKNMSGKVLRKEDLHTTSLVTARAKVVKAIGMDPNISGGIFPNPDAIGLPVGFIYFPNKGYQWSHFWIAFINRKQIPYLVDSKGKIKRRG